MKTRPDWSDFNRRNLVNFQPPLTEMANGWYRVEMGAPYRRTLVNFQPPLTTITDGSR